MQSGEFLQDFDVLKDGTKVEPQAKMGSLPKSISGFSQSLSDMGGS